MPRILPFLPVILALTGCQSMTPGGARDIPDDTVLLSSRHCLSEYIKDLDKVQLGPCLKVVSVDGQAPKVNENGFIALPVATDIHLQTSCVYRHADGTPIPATVESASFRITPDTFKYGGRRWYLHAQTQARGVVGCQPTLAPSIYPTYKTN